MKFLIYTLFALIILNACKKDFSNKPDNSALLQKIEKLSYDDEYFKLRDLLEINKKNIPEKDYLKHQAFVKCAFFKTQESNNLIDTLFDKYENDLEDSTKVDLINTRVMNYLLDFNYSKAAEQAQILVDNYHTIGDSSDFFQRANILSILSSLREIAPQIVHKNQAINIAAYKNKFNHQNLPVTLDSKKLDFVFDTGANFSMITESNAQKMSLKRLEAKANIKTSTSIKLDTKIAVADSIHVGDLLFENVVFLVIPDESFTFPEIDYKIEGIIGAPLLIQMEEIQFLKDGTLYIPKEPTRKKLTNLYMNGYDPIAQFITPNDSLNLLIDTGATKSSLNSSFYETHKTQIKNSGTISRDTVAGVGGYQIVEKYKLTDFPYRIGSVNGTLTNLSVETSELTGDVRYDGALGQDMFLNYNKMILNFKDMYIDFE